MPMMRRGPLDRYPPEWVLRQANAHAAEGSIEFHSDHPVTVFLHAGRVYAIEDGVNLQETELAALPSLSEQKARTRAVSLLSPVMGARAGWYYHDPLGQHPSRGSWVWETATLIMDTRTKAHETTSLATWTDRNVALRPTEAGEVTLGPDAWAIVVCLARKATAGDLRAQLAWSPDRIARALTEIEQRGVLAPASTWRPPPPPEAEAEAAAGPGALHHQGPLAPPPVPEASLRRRMLPARRPVSP